MESLCLRLPLGWVHPEVHAETQRGRRDRRESLFGEVVGYAGYAVFDQVDVEVDEEAQAFVG